MRDECEGPVPAEGPMDAEIALIGEAPGRGEDDTGRPWMGAAGQYLMALLRSIGLTREQVWLSNIGKCRPTGNRTPTPEEAQFCASRWLSVELNMVKPRIIGLLGDVATSYFLGEGTMYERHGKPIEWPIRGDEYGHPVEYVTLLPMYHPAAGLYDKGDRRLADILEDFKVLEQLVRGEWEPVVDTHPTVHYAEMGEAAGLHSNGMPRAYDTEWVDGKLWSIQTSSSPGMAEFYTPQGDVMVTGETVVHSYMADGRMIDLPPNTKDTQLMAYLLGLPQGLKELAKRLCGMEMESYQEVTRKFGKDKAMAYLEQAVALHPDSPPTKAI